MSFIEWLPDLKLVASDFFQLAGDVNVKSLREPLKRTIQQVVAPALQENFDSSGHGTWEPLADVTLAMKGRKGQPSNPLIATGKLRRKAGQLNVWTINGPAGEATLDQLSDVEYGYVHQFGSTTIPQREWAALTSADIEKVEEVFGRWLDERIVARMGV